MRYNLLVTPACCRRFRWILSERKNFLANNRQLGRHLGPLPTLGLWAALCFGGGLYASWQGYGGRAFAATLTVFSFYFGVMLLFAARGVPLVLSPRFVPALGYLPPLPAFFSLLAFAIA